MISSQLMRGLLAACAFLCALTPAALAQQGQLVGVVIDAEFGDPLPGANIIVEGTATGTATDFEGRYTLALAPGTYDVVYSFIGYQDQTVRGIEITAGQDTEINVNLGTDAVQMDGEVVVEAEALRNSEGILLRDRKKAAAVSDAISAEAISRSGSSTASDAMQKVTGASVVGGKYVYVRGLGDRYINTQLNGADLPSADPDRNAVPLDLFPSGLLDNIVTSKTFTPDKPGSFTGGTVDIATKSFPDAFTLSISSSATYNTSASLQSDFIQHSDGPINLLGSVDLDVPESLSDPSVEIPRLSDARRDVETAGQLNDLSQAFSTPFAPGFGSTPVNQSYGFSLGNRFDLGGRPLGVVGSLSYSRNFSGYAGTNYARFRLSGAEATTLSPIYSLEDQNSTEEVLAGGLVNVTYRFLPQHQVGVNYMYNQSAEAEARFLEGFVDQVGELSTYQSRALGITERQLSALQVRGESGFGSRGQVKVDWNASFGTSNQDEPDLRFFTNNLSPRGFDIELNRPPERYFRELEETNNSANLNLTIPFRQWNGLASRFKVGGSYLAKDRTFRERQFAFRYDGGSYPLNEYEGDVGAFVDAELGIDDERTTERRTRFGLYVTDLSQPSNNYDGDQEVAAGYVMLDMPLMPSLRFVGGVRYETTEINVASLNEDIEPGELSEADLLPSLGLTWEANEQTNLRLAYGRTLARPTFRELAPFSGFEFVGDVILLGNPGLERTLIDSYDARWEWFVRPGEIYAVSAFYKGFENPIERAFDPRGTGGNGQVTFVNVPEGTVYGLEFEVRKRLDQLGDAFQNFQAGANLTLTQSEVDIEAEELDARRQTNPDAPDTRSFSGQSAFVFNIDLGYNNPERGTSLNVFYNVFGERLLEAGRGGTPDIFEQPRNDFDITFTQRLISGFTLKASAKNLLNAKYEITQEYLGTEYILQDYDLGRSFSIGVSYGL